MNNSSKNYLKYITYIMYLKVHNKLNIFYHKLYMYYL